MRDEIAYDIFVKNLHRVTTSFDLVEHIEAAGFEVECCWFNKRDYKTNELLSRPFASVKLADASRAAECIEKFNNTELHTRTIIVLPFVRQAERVRQKLATKRPRASRHSAPAPLTPNFMHEAAR
jgi:hypothetical protein